MAGKPKQGDSGGNSGKGGMMRLLAALLLLTMVAGGVGFLGGHQLRRSLAQPVTPTTSSVSVAKIAKAEGLQLVALPPIVTNLAGESGWVRIEASVLLAEEKPVAATLAGQLAEDIVALLRTLTLSQIGGASGYHHLREEILDRLRTRTGGRSREISIQSMIIE